MSIEEIIKAKIHRAEWNGRVHLYWQYQRETLCGQDKTNRPRVYLQEPTCQKCLAGIGEIVFEQMRRDRLVA